MPTSSHPSPTEILSEVSRLAREPSTSDRFLAITCAAAIEDYTSLIFSNQFKEHNNQIANHAAERINHIAKLSICYKMKLIHKDTFLDAQIIAEIRNKFAHSLKYNSFDNAEISKKLRKLNLYKSVNFRGSQTYVSEDYKTSLDNINNNRIIFSNSALVCIADLFNIVCALKN